MAVGESRVEGLLEGEDVLATAAALRAMGVEIERAGDGSWRVWGVGVGGLAEPDDVLDLGNAGTGARLLMGLLAGHALHELSHRRRLAALAADAAGDRAAGPDGRHLPRPHRRPAAAGADRPRPTCCRSTMRARWPRPRSSRRCCWPGCTRPGRRPCIEPLASRDHSERMLAAMGARGRRSRHCRTAAGASRSRGQPELRAAELRRPGRPVLGRLPDRRGRRRAGLRGPPARASGSTRCAPASIPRLREMGADITHRRTSATPAASRWATW